MDILVRLPTYLFDQNFSTNNTCMLGCEITVISDEMIYNNNRNSPM